MNLSVVIITLNAERTLEKVLEPLSFVQDIVILDSGSTDRTKEIALKYKARFFHQDFLGFGRQKQFAVALAKNDWVLAIDADEVLSPELIHFLTKTLNYSESSYAGYTLPIINVFLGKVLDFWGGEAQSHLRIFRKTEGNFNDLSVHERVIVRGQTKSIPYPIFHYSYQDIHHYFLKFNQYTTNAARELKGKGKVLSIPMMLLRIPLKFFQLYFLRGGFTLGWQGLLWSVFSSFYVFVKYAKLRELEQGQ
ncbi:MAG: glycosyltransferase family 2 protein [Bacteriovoracaceae bacterium]